MAVWAAIANFASTWLGMLSLVITVPLTLPYLGQERFGVWMTVSSFGAMLSFMDFGVSNSLINRVASAKATEDISKLQFTILHGLTILTLIGISIAVVLIPLSSLLPWDRLIKVASPIATEEARKAISIFLLLFAAGIPVGGIQKIYQGLQRAWIVHIVKGIGSTVSLALVYHLAHEKAGAPTLLLATLGIQTFMPLLLLAPLIKDKLIKLPSVTWLSWVAESKTLVNIGGLFFILQIGGLIGWGADLLITSSFLGASEASKLALVQRLFQIVSLPLSIINAPLWSAYADASARNDRLFIKKTLKKSLLGTACFAAVTSITVVTFSGFLFERWTKGTIQITSALVLLYGIWIVFEATGNAFAMFLNGNGILRPQMVVVILFCVIAIPLKVILITCLGLPGLILAALISYLVTIVIPYLTFLRRTWILRLQT